MKEHSKNLLIRTLGGTFCFLIPKNTSLSHNCLFVVVDIFDSSLLGTFGTDIFMWYIIKGLLTQFMM